MHVTSEQESSNPHCPAVFPGVALALKRRRGMAAFGSSAEPFRSLRRMNENKHLAGIAFATLLAYLCPRSRESTSNNPLGEFMPVVELAAVTKAYENKVAVHNLSLSIQAGQMFGLLGPNGAGKTSSIRMMMGITGPDSGSVRLFDKPFERASLDRVGYLPEERGLYKKMKVIDQLVFFGELHGLAAPEARERAGTWAERLEIADSLDKKTEELSKGMQQKIQFIASLLHDPGLIVMDEPFSGLDPVNAVLLQDALLELKAQGRAILFSTHRMDQVEKLCDSICLINNGEAVLSGNLREIKSHYERNRIKIEFEGSADFLSSPEIAEARNYAGHAEIRLHPHGDAQKLLHLAASMATIYRFELVEPSLEEIFIQTVGGKANA
jgi:ABC-2 type transport system ATP-binding protein